MKRVTLSFLLLLAVVFTAGAQSAQYESAMTKQVALLDDPASFNPAKLGEISNTFERIAAAEKSQWLPYYYAAYSQVMAALIEQNKDKVDAIVDKVDANLAKVDELSPNNDEAACIKSLAATARLMVDPQSRGMQYGMASAQELQKAQTINAENPRVYLLQGQSLFYTPEQFGGSKARAKEKFQAAIEKYASFKPASKLAPHWGEKRAKELLAEANK
ncbi:hypothetical protein KTO58_21100 [Chitinophaga pendula]|uniref:hypothetical protein n=1 Tax=Chitinophaga TaxID=79328 RepID=UPI000BAEE5FF|nr:MULTISPECIES: hypothetical protein [Chitinophaga]ASZ10870.1 hypothetical protein CK934_07705 [Chitinophaga sp. MD30]UCJ06147.1 hypothetical protein KTO58_21100 [Chitinophaga pendula]